MQPAPARIFFGRVAVRCLSPNLLGLSQRWAIKSVTEMNTSQAAPVLRKANGGGQRPVINLPPVWFINLPLTNKDFTHTQ